MTSVLDGTLDAHSRDDLTRMSARSAAEAQYHDELARYASPHDWWRIATLPDGEPVGFVDVVRVRPLYARAAGDNVGSLKVLQKAGFAIVGTETSYANARGTEIEETILRLDGPPVTV